MSTHDEAEQILVRAQAEKQDVELLLSAYPSNPPAHVREALGICADRITAMLPALDAIGRGDYDQVRRRAQGSTIGDMRKAKQGAHGLWQIHKGTSKAGGYLVPLEGISMQKEWR